MAKLKNVVTAYMAKQNEETGFIDVFGVFDNLVQPFFPFGLPNLSILLTIEELKAPTMFEVRVNAPDGTLIAKGEFGVLPDPFGVGKKVIDMEQFLVTDRGQYTIDILEKISEDKVKFMTEYDLFIADYPPQRQMSDEEREAILKAPNDEVIKSIKSDFKFNEEMEPVHIQVNVDKNAPIDEGYIAIPENDRLEVGGQTYDLTGIRRQMEWMFGREIPKEAPKEEVKDEKIVDISEKK